MESQLGLWELMENGYKKLENNKNHDDKHKRSNILESLLMFL